MLWTAAAAVVAAFLCALWLYARRICVTASSDASLLQGPRKILLVTAHPDDESFFFTPTIKGVLQRQPLSEISLLCLSSGIASRAAALNTDDQQGMLPALGK